MTSSIANETVDHSKNREPFSFYKFITNKYLLVGINYSNTSDNKKHTCIIESINNLD